MRTVLHVGPSESRGGMGAVIQLLATHPPDGWKADVLASHSDGGVIDVLKAWWNAARDSKPDWQSVMLMLFIFTLQHDGRGDAKLD